MTKIPVSPEWTPEERQKVTELIQETILELEEEEKRVRKVIPSDIPYFRENRRRIEKLKILQKAIKGLSSELLEKNRESFGQFIE